MTSFPFPARPSTRQQLTLLLAVLIGGTAVVSLVAMAGIVFVRGQIVRLSRDTSPTQIRLAQLQRGFEAIGADFARISAASSIGELSAVEAELNQTLDQALRISSDLSAGASTSGSGSEVAVIDRMRRTGEQLRAIARERIDARKKLADSDGKITAEVDRVTVVTQAMSAAMAEMQKSSQGTLQDSTRASAGANASIQALLAERLQTEQLRSCIQQTALVDQKFRLNVLRDRAAGILDGMKAPDLHDAALETQLTQFVSRFGPLFNGDAGLIAARAAVLASPGDPVARFTYDVRRRKALAEVGELSTRLAEQADSLGLAVVQAAAGVSQATGRIARVTAISSAVARVSIGARQIRALAWQFFAATDPASVDRLESDVASQSDRVLQDLEAMRAPLKGFPRANAMADVSRVPEAFVRVRNLLNGPGGIGSDVKSDLEKQRKTARLYATALQSIREVTAAGSVRARASERAQERAVREIQRLSAIAAFVIGVVTLLALWIGLHFGSRVSQEVLAAEASQLCLKETLRQQAFHDSLTGLPNRLLFDNLLSHALETAAQRRARVGLLGIDLDRFKQVNDRLGHHAGDMYLIEIAKRMKSVVGEGDTVARVGGDEFLVLLPEPASTEQLQARAESILKALSAPVMIENCSLQAGGSIGIACFPDDGGDSETLLKNADRAMYRAKASGRNQCVSFDWHSNQTQEERVEIQRLLAEALRNGEFRVVYQPQVNIDGALSGLEALLRFRHPKFGAIPPSQFIPMAEEIGLIVPMGDWVLNEVVRQSLAWQAEGLPPVRIAVNVSALQFTQADFQVNVSQLLARSGLAPELLELELTETVVMSHLDDAHRQMMALRSLGVRLSIDDFGTGYSSLSYLHKLPVDSIKIDQSFVREMHAPASTLPLIQAIVSAAHAFGLSVVAEGVETDIQKQSLIAIGCDSLQGYLFARPLSPDMVRELLRQAPDTDLAPIPPIEACVEGSPV